MAAVATHLLVVAVCREVETVPISKPHHLLLRSLNASWQRLPSQFNLSERFIILYSASPGPLFLGMVGRWCSTTLYKLQRVCTCSIERERERSSEIDLPVLPQLIFLVEVPIIVSSPKKETRRLQKKSLMCVCIAQRPYVRDNSKLITCSIKQSVGSK